MSSPAIGSPATTVSVISPDYQRSSAPVVDNKAPPEQTYMGNYVANPQCKMQASTAVTPIKTFIPVLKDVSWAIGLAAVIMELFDDGYKSSFKKSEERIVDAIDYNDYLPTSLGGYTLKIADRG